MPQMMFRRRGLFVGILAISLLMVPAWSQQPAASTAPSPVDAAKSYVGLGVTNGAKGDLDSAIGAFNEAIKIDPQYAPAYYYRGFAYSSQHKLDEAISDYGKAIQIDPKYKEAYYQRGCMEGTSGNFDGAMSDFNEVIKLDPQYASAYYNMGHVKYFKGDLDGAVGQLDRALDLAPDSFYAYYIRGLIRHAQGDRTGAISDFQKSSNSGFLYAAFWVWIAKMEDGRRGLAREDLMDALVKPESSHSGDWPSQIGNFLLGVTTQDQLMAKVKTGSEVESNEHACQAWFYSGMVKHFAGDGAGAKDCFAKAIATGSKSSEEFVEADREAAELSAP